MLKKILAALLAGAMILSFAACGDREEANEPSNPSEETNNTEDVGYFVGSDAKALYEKIDLGKNPNNINEEALTIFKNAVNRDFGRETGRLEKNDIATTYCTHGSMQTLSKYKLDYDISGSSVTAAYSVAPNSEVSDLVHHGGIACNLVPTKGTPSAPAVDTKDAVLKTIAELEGVLLQKGLESQYIKSATLRQEAPAKGETKGAVYITLEFAPDVEEKLFSNATTLGANDPTGTVVYSAQIKLDGEGQLKTMTVSKDIQDETGTKFDLLDSKYYFKNMAGRASGNEAA